MAARQTNKRPAGRKTTARKKTSKSKSAGGGVFLGIGLIAVLIALISFSIMSITGSKDKEEPKTVTVIPAQKKETAEKKEQKTEKEKKEQAAKTVPVPKKETAKKEEPKKEKEQETVSSDKIADLIRLVLYDHEISRSSVKERQSKTSTGKDIIYFDITCDENMQRGISSAISSILRKYGYKVEAAQNKVVGSSKKDEFNIVLKAPKKEVVKKEEPKKEVVKQEEKKEPVKEKPQVAETPKYPPLPPYSKKQVKFAILLDDGGNSAELAKEYADIKYPVAVAVLPHLEHSRYTAEVAKKAGKTVFLHFPMAPKSYPNTDPGRGAVLPNMPELLISGVVKENFESLGVKVDGFNNHMGSAITEDAHKMSQILSASKKYTNRFVDSRTTAQTKAYEECKKAGYKCGENRLFLDNDNSVEAILAKIYEAAEKSRDDGSIIAIGHVRPNTLAALKIALPQLEKLNYHLVDIKKLIN